MSSDLKVLHRAIRYISSLALSSFFTEIHVIGGENVPKDGPIIVTATHHNMMLDPAVLSVAFPHHRMLHYWSKASLFANPVLRYILSSTGNIPVERKSKDRQVLFKGTIEALSDGHAIALFPEGTSYTETRIMQVKDGAAWAALEYTRWAADNPNKAEPDLVIIPAAIVYTNKSKYRSSVIMEFGRPISLDKFREQFLIGDDSSRRATVKRLTRVVEEELIEATINAPDWDTLYAARMAREILWEGDKAIKLEDFVVVSQTLVDVFSTPNATHNMNSVKRNLLEYYSLLQSSHLTNSVLSSLPLPRSLDPNTPATMPSRLLTLLILIRDSISCLIRLPFFLFPLIIHFPVYIMGRIGAKLVEDEEETQAQNKVVFGLLSLLLIYPTTFLFLWALSSYTAVGALIAAVTVYMFAIYHNKLIDENYEHAKRLLAAWRVLVGVWLPKRWDLSLSALAPYTTPRTPPENPWIDKPKTAPDNSLITTTPTKPPSGELAATTRSGRRPPSRRLIRHVLRARIEAVKALASFFDQLQRASPSKRLHASKHLAKIHGTVIEKKVSEGEGSSVELEGWRDAQEVIQYLRKKGAKIPTSPSRESIAAGWAALSSDGEGDNTDKEQSEPRWVPSSTDI